MQRLAYRLLLLLALAGALPLRAQVFPGDVDDNGRVEHIDLLYIGYAYGTVGPARIESSTDFAAQSVPQQWQQTFSNGLNYAYADANGNGWVEMGDFLTVNLNYGDEQATVTPVTPPPAIAGIDPVLGLSDEQLPGFIGQGSLLTIPIRLGTPDQPVTLNGLAFTIDYDAAFIQEVQLDLSDSWLGTDNGAVVYQSEPSFTGASGKIEAAVTRFGAVPVNGHGPLGELQIVIEDDLIGLLPPGEDSIEITIGIRVSKAVDGSFADRPIVDDSLSFMIYHPDFLASTSGLFSGRDLRVYPNPARDRLTVECPAPWQALTLVDALGRTVWRRGNYSLVTLIGTQSFPPGLYWLRLLRDDGVISRAVYIK